jgi:hypothetical protein
VGEGGEWRASRGVDARVLQGGYGAAAVFGDETAVRVGLQWQLQRCRKTALKQGIIKVYSYSRF